MVKIFILLLAKSALGRCMNTGMIQQLRQKPTLKVSCLWQLTYARLKPRQQTHSKGFLPAVDKYIHIQKRLPGGSLFFKASN
ncbi:hypothetical protein A9Q98_15655 [Thalassotalea sp. 42_200_T64]|nr:hypothetical protein A9Q98_15655 [Thalassotalea sp. 42_200_T64]